MKNQNKFQYIYERLRIAILEEDMNTANNCFLNISW